MVQYISFESFGLKDSLMKAVEEIGFKVPSPIQQQVIPKILAGADLIGQAHTGTGKTAAFGLPALHLLKEEPRVQLLVITPTRELATQVSEELYRLGSYCGIKTATIYGGASFATQIAAVKRGAQVVVATPGRLLDLLESGRLPHFQPSIVVLDEADEMLDMGFLEDIQKIFTFLPQKRQTLLFSATMPIPIQQLAQKILQHPVFISVTHKETTNKDIAQVYYIINERERDNAIIRLLDSHMPHKSIIFCRTKKDVDRLTMFLIARGHQARGLHGDMEQSQREEVIRCFRSEQVTTLVATDVAARGLNISDISHVFNYHLPFDPSSYVHRIGRTGRAGNKGVASTFVTPKEYKDFQRYGKMIGTHIKQDFIPTLEDVKRAQIAKLVNEIHDQPLHEEAQRVLKTLQGMDMTALASKLLSLLLDRQKIQGPDQIGMDTKHLEEQLVSEKSKRYGRQSLRRGEGQRGRGRRAPKR